MKMEQVRSTYKIRTLRAGLHTKLPIFLYIIAARPALNKTKGRSTYYMSCRLYTPYVRPFEGCFLCQSTSLPSIRRLFVSSRMRYVRYNGDRLPSTGIMVPIFFEDEPSPHFLKSHASASPNLQEKPPTTSCSGNMLACYFQRKGGRNNKESKEEQTTGREGEGAAQRRKSGGTASTGADQNVSIRFYAESGRKPSTVKRGVLKKSMASASDPDVKANNTQVPPIRT